MKAYVCLSILISLKNEESKIVYLNYILYGESFALLELNYLYALLK